MAQVDIGSLYIMTVGPSQELLGGGVREGTSSIELYWGADIAPGQWFQAALHITPGQPLAQAGITRQGPMMDGNGSTGLGVVVNNFSQNFNVRGVTPTVEVSINVLSAPAHGF